LRKLYSSTKLLRGVLLSYGGEFVTVSASERAGKPGSGLLAFDTRSGEKISELWDGEQNSLEMMVPSPLPGDPRLLASTTRTGIETLLIWNPYSGEQIDLNLGDVTGALRAFDWSPDGSSILFRTFNAAVQQLYIHNLHTGVTIPLGHPDGANIEPYFTPAGDEIFSHWQSSTCPPRLIALSARTGETTRTVISAGDAPPGRAWTSIMFPSLDGQQVQGWLGLPEGAGPFPAVIEAHGGPFEVQGEAFSPGAQAWLDHGFAYLSVNYRGSTTFGRQFERKIYGLPGAWEIEDLVAARRWLVESDIARPDSVLLTGWSYGGFLTLLALGRTPDLWAGGMARAAIADEYQSNTRKARRVFQRLGWPSPSSISTGITPG
jgi:dipeptidyl aminopeptidase/acylaminoacyl peptidase